MFLFLLKCFIISIHAPAGGASSSTVSISGGTVDFNSRPCGRGFCFLHIFLQFCYISIHAPAGGASYRVSLTLNTLLQISIHAPAGGASVNIGEDIILSFISIHAPAGGASWAQLQAAQKMLISIHAPAGGASNIKIKKFGEPPRFQFTPLREGLLH